MAFVKGTTGSSTSSPTVTTAFSGSTTSGNLIVVTVSDDSALTTNGMVVSDSKGNTFVKVLHTANASTLSMWYCGSIGGGASHTITATWSEAATGKCTVVAQEFDGGFSVLDKSAVATGSSTSPSSGATATTTAANETVVGGLSHASTASTISLGSGYTNLGSLNTADAANGQESKVVAATGAQTAGFSIAASRAWVAGVLTFKTAAGAVDLAGTASAAASATGSASVDRPLAGSASAASSGTASLGAARPLAATASAASSATGSLSLASDTADMAGTIAAASGASGALTVTRGLAGTVPAATSATADLTTVGLFGVLELTPNLGVPVSSGQVRRPNPRWRVMIAHTRSGQLLGELPYQDLAWTDTLDFTRTSSLSVTVPLESAEDVARIRSIARGQWRYTLIAAYDGVPIVAGPLLTHKVGPDVTSVELGCGGPASILAARLITRLNLMPNPSFETGIDDWTAIGPVGSTTAQITQSVPPTDATPPDGESWLRVTSGGSSGTIAVASPRVPITAGLPYTVSAYNRNSASSQTTQGFILWYDSLTGDPWEWDSFEYSSWGDTFGNWVRKSVTAVAPTWAVALAIQVQAPATASGHYLDLDMVFVELSTDVNSANEAQGEVKVGPLSLPEIARRMILVATMKMGAAPGAELPLDLPEDIVADGPHVRTYKMHELGTIAERLGQLTQVEGGPDVHLRPVIYAPLGNRYMAWEVRIGQSRLGQSGPGWVWTYDANCTKIAIDSDASNMTMRAYVPGQADTDTGTPVGSAEDLSLLDVGWPLLERGDGARSTTETTVNLEAQAEDFLRANDRPVEAWPVTARADMHPRLGTWQLGDNAMFRIRGHRWLEDGDYPRRLLSVSGDASDEITLGVTSGEGQV